MADTVQVYVVYDMADVSRGSKNKFFHSDFLIQCDTRKPPDRLPRAVVKTVFENPHPINCNNKKNFIFVFFFFLYALELEPIC